MWRRLVSAAARAFQLTPWSTPGARGRTG
jgi:hypothetical protein